MADEVQRAWELLSDARWRFDAALYTNDLPVMLLVADEVQRYTKQYVQALRAFKTGSTE